MRPTSLCRGVLRPSLLRTQGSRGAVAHAPRKSVASTASALARATAEYRRPVARAQPAASEPDLRRPSPGVTVATNLLPFAARPASPVCGAVVSRGACCRKRTGRLRAIPSARPLFGGGRLPWDAVEWPFLLGPC